MPSPTPHLRVCRIMRCNCTYNVHTISSFETHQWMHYSCFILTMSTHIWSYFIWPHPWSCIILVCHSHYTNTQELLDRSSCTYIESLYQLGHICTWMPYQLVQICTTLLTLLYDVLYTFTIISNLVCVHIHNCNNIDTIVKNCSLNKISGWRTDMFHNVTTFGIVKPI